MLAFRSGTSPAVESCFVGTLLRKLVWIRFRPAKCAWFLRRRLSSSPRSVPPVAGAGSQGDTRTLLDCEYPDGHFASHYTGGSRTPTGERRYLSMIRDVYSAIRPRLADDAVIAQLIGFANVRTQLPLYLEAMKAAGFQEWSPAAFERRYGVRCRTESVCEDPRRRRCVLGVTIVPSAKACPTLTDQSVAIAGPRYSVLMIGMITRARP